MAGEPLVVQTMRRFKLDLLAREQAVMQEMARRWLQVEDALEAQITALAYEVAGGPVSQAKLFQLERYRQLLAQTQEQFSAYAGYADGRISAYQGDNGRAGLAEAVKAIGASYAGAGIPAVSFFRLPAEAIEFMVGSTRAGTPLGELLRERIDPQFGEKDRRSAWEYLTQALIKGTAMGRNPRTVAREMRGVLAGGLQKALVIARTEGLRPYREASRLQYEESGVVQAHKRLAAHDGRVCAACIAEDRQELPVSVTMYDHPQGRCTSVPVVDGLPPVTWTAGEEWFALQDVETQRAILKDDLLEAWRAGDVAFGDIARHTFDPVWGGSLTPRPLSELLDNRDRGRREPEPPAVEEPKKGTAAGQPVSAALQIPRSGKYAKDYQAALDLVDGVHGDGDLPQIPLKTKTFRNGTSGQYVHYLNSGKPAKIEIDPKKRQVEATIAHESGHFIDHQAMGQPGKFASLAAAFGEDSVLDEWWAAVQDSEAVRGLQDRRDNPEKYRLRIERYNRTYTAEPRKQFLAYLLSPQELFARSYEQYIGLRSGNRAIRDQLAREKEDELYPGTYWADEDFGPIARAIDKAFEVLGWLKR